MPCTYNAYLCAMCGRYSQKTKQLVLEDDLELQHLLELNPEPRYNIGPTQNCLVVTSEQPRRLQLMRWGFRPAWAKDLKRYPPMINAVSESLQQSSYFREAFRQRRCLVPADGFYEWKATPIGKRPMYIHAQDERSLVFAGIWEEWRDAEDRATRSFAILTTSPNGLMQDIHDRMPVILPTRAAREKWLDPATSLDELNALLIPCPDELLQAHEVSTLVNSVRNDGPELILPPEALPPGFGGGQQSLF